MNVNIKTIAGLVLLGLFIIVCIQNVEAVPLHFLFWSAAISKLLLLILTLVVGISLGILIQSFWTKSKENKTVN